MRSENTITMTYKERLQADYERIRADTKAGILPLPKRLDEIRQATDRYALAHAEEYDEAVAQAMAEGRSPGTVPIPFKDMQLLHNMADLCMDEYLRWSHPDKMTIVEYPVMSDRQADTRERKETLISEMSYGRDPHVGYKTVCYDDKNGATRMHRKKIFNYSK